MSSFVLARPTRMCPLPFPRSQIHEGIRERAAYRHALLGSLGSGVRICGRACARYAPRGEVGGVLVCWWGGCWCVGGVVVGR